MIVKNKVLHISTDNKFIEGAKNTFNQIFEYNTFLILSYFFQKLKFVKSGNNILIWRYHRFLLSLNSNFFNEYDIIILHDMNYFNSRLVIKRPELNYIYISWGYEIYNNKYILEKFPGIDIFNYNPIKAKSFKKYCINLIKYGLIISEHKNYEIIFKAINKIENIVISKTEWNLLKALNILNSQCNLMPSFSYNPFVQIATLNKKAKDINIIVGNCSVEEIGHIKIFEILSKFSIDRIISPLSYGDFKYRKLVITTGEVLFQEKFQPIIEFEDLSSYREYFKNSSFYFDSSKRQRAWGNIVLCLEFGLKIFLNPLNPIYSLIKSLGGNVYSIEELSENSLKKLTVIQMNENQQIIRKYYSKEAIKSNWINYFNSKNLK